MTFRVCLAVLAASLIAAFAHAQDLCLLPKQPRNDLALAQPASREPLLAIPYPQPPPFVAPLAHDRLTLPGEIADLVSLNLLRKGGSTGPRITFPAQTATTRAIKRLALRQVSSRPGRCAGTMREALGWGLGDAHQWMKLPKVGFKQRSKAQGAQPGDIVVWPFTFGSRRSQHIGVAVGTDKGVRLLSNLSGSLCLSALAPGYAAFYKDA